MAQVKSAARHNVVDLSTHLCRTLRRGVLFCDQHVDEPVTTYCFDCRLALCSCCAGGRTHRLHRPVLEQLRPLPILIGSRPIYHYFRSVCLSVCFCRVFLSRLRSDLDQTRTHVTCPLEYRGSATPGGWVTPKNWYF